MRPKHIAFVLGEAYGHIMPTLGIASELIRRGYRVSYAVTAHFAPAVIKIGARAIIFTPLDVRRELCRLTEVAGGGYDFSNSDLVYGMVCSRARHSLAQIAKGYSSDRPDLIVHDGGDLAAQELAIQWGIPRIRVHLLPFERQVLTHLTDESTIIIPVPKFFNRDLDAADERFHFVGFIPEGRAQVAQPWEDQSGLRKTILASPTTGLVPQNDFCRLVISAFGGTDYQVVLSIPGDFDPVCAVDPAAIRDLPENFRLNRYSSHMEILPNSCLFIGQGGPGSTLEALYFGVPVILIPPTLGHENSASRAAELGLGLCLSIAEVTAMVLKNAAVALMGDTAVRTRLLAAQKVMTADSGARDSANIVEGKLRCMIQ